MSGMSCPQEWDFLHLASKKCVLPFSHYSTLEEARNANLAAIETAVKMLDDDEHDFIIGNFRTFKLRAIKSNIFLKKM